MFLFLKRLLFKFRLRNTPDKILYIIGNGFDLHHGLDTWYSSFGLYLQKNQSSVYDNLVKYVCMPELDEDDPSTLNSTEWNELEKSLANLLFDEIIDEYSEYAANIGADDFSDRDWGTIEVYVSEIRDDLTDQLLAEFKEFIRQVEYPPITDSSALNIKKEANFFNFNYTLSLQKYYQVNDSKIFYVHGSVSDEDPLILGHGFNPDNFKPEELKPPAGATPEELERWEDEMSDSFDLSIELGKDALLQYFSKSYKKTKRIIEENEPFFESLKKCKRVLIFGHSLAPVDEEYFTKIKSSVHPKAKWFVSCRNDSEKSTKKQRLIDMGISGRKIYPFNVKVLKKYCSK